MAIPSSSAIIAASRDQDLSERITAVMATMGVGAPEFDTQRLRREIVIVPIAGGATLAGVYEYASEMKRQAIQARETAIREAEESHPIPPDPGVNPAAVTDDHLRAAIQALIDTDKITGTKTQN